jgi:neocarzinostatin family protein
MVRVRLLRAAAAALVLAAPLALGALAVGSGAATTPHLVVTPSTGLKNGTTVKVSGTGFKPHDMVFIVECLRTAKGAGGCATAMATPVTITGKGVMPATKFKVATGKIGSGKCGTTTGNLKGCEVSAGNASGKDTASANITFKLP